MMGKRMTEFGEAVAMKGVIFDFNGTMVFDEALHTKAWRQFLGQTIGRPGTEAEFQQYVHGRNVENTLSYFLKRTLSPAEIDGYALVKEELYRVLAAESPDYRLAAGLPEYLDELKKRGIPMTIATASPQSNVDFYFRQFPLERWFRREGVVYNDGTIPGKPEPDIYLKAAAAIGRDISDCAVFEDARAGIEAAKRAGAGIIVGVASMLREETLLRLGATVTIRDYRERETLYALLEQDGAGDEIQ